MNAPDYQILFDGDTAWWVMRPEVWSTFESLYRPCERCDGDGGIDEPDGYSFVRCQCPDCDGTGRHTFNIQVEVDHFIEPQHHHVLVAIHRVSIVEGVVLSIVSDVDPAFIVRQEYPLITIDPITDRVIHHVGPDIEDMTDITLPPAAEPGMLAIQLQVADGMRRGRIAT